MGVFSLSFVIVLAEAAAQASVAVAPPVDPLPVPLERSVDHEPPVVLDDKKCVKISYPEFYDHWERLRA